jgi:Stage III sporulation protein AB (spore_III_AB).
MQNLLQLLENRISYLSDILTDAFDRIKASSQNEVGIFFSYTSERLKTEKNINATDAWEAAIRENIKKTALNKEDEEILVSFGKILGGSDTEGQINNIRHTINQLKMQEEKAEKSRIKNEKMYKSLGILGGLAVIVILM